MNPFWTEGPLSVTPYSLMIFLGALAGAALSLRKKHIRPLLPAVILGALVFGHAVWVLFCPYDLEAAEGKLYMLLRPWEGGYTLYGALLGGALGALTWELDHAETQPWKAPPDPLLEKVAALVTEDKPSWTGSATELLTLLGEDMKPNILTRRLNVKNGELKSEYGIALTVSHNRNGSCISLSRLEQEV